MIIFIRRFSLLEQFFDSRRVPHIPQNLVEITFEPPWSDISAALWTLSKLTGESLPDRLSLEANGGNHLRELVGCLDEQGWEIEAYYAPEGLLYRFFHEQPRRPLLAHSDRNGGLWLVLVGMLQGHLVAADFPGRLMAVPMDSFFKDYSGSVLSFPQLHPLPAVESLLERAERHLRRIQPAANEGAQENP